ncbi:hypothetical protein F751_0573 [Auxenochlorella protothecoides]|uniref:Uncharacterized protein n=1 Tax=Auxenochlorella protothecoides TaxID=3075 RepID=A0A087SIJ2_AUXPR|nr:hypothetical protein F751_0573 [Auxenochlorella protothecoides]KFM25546.1 hypothetical protein F751_0573 [Auxenochlorella protothecoides]
MSHRGARTVYQGGSPAPCPFPVNCEQLVVKRRRQSVLMKECKVGVHVKGLRLPGSRRSSAVLAGVRGVTAPHTPARRLHHRSAPTRTRSACALRCRAICDRALASHLGSTARLKKMAGSRMGSAPVGVSAGPPQAGLVCSSRSWTAALHSPAQEG